MSLMVHEGSHRGQHLEQRKIYPSVMSLWGMSLLTRPTITLKTILNRQRGRFPCFWEFFAMHMKECVTLDANKHPTVMCMSETDRPLQPLHAANGYHERYIFQGRSTRRVIEMKTGVNCLKIDR